MAEKPGRIRAFFAVPPTPAPHPFNRRDQKILLAAAIVFQALYLLIIPLGFECDAAMYLNFSRYVFGAEGGTFNYYRAPGFPIFLGLSGQLLFGSFIPTVAAHAVMGVLSPLLFYRSLAPVSRAAAFIAAGIFILSTTPFYGAKIMLVEQLFAFLIVAGFYGFSRYYFTRDVRFFHLSLFCFYAATFTRWEANPLLFVGFIVFFFIARKRERHLRHLVLVASLLAVLATGWSAVRSSSLAGDMSLFGSLHNWGGRQSFWIIYRGQRRILEKWEEVLGWRGPDNESIVEKLSFSLAELPYSDLQNIPYVRPSNGPQTEKLREWVVKIATKNPESYRSLKPWMAPAQQKPGRPHRDYYEEYFGHFDGNPEALADNYFIQPNIFYIDYLESELRKQIGLDGLNELLGSVFIETISANPRIVALLAVESAAKILSLFGFDLESMFSIQTPNKQTFRSPVFSFWAKNHFSDVYYNIGGCAEAHLSPHMRREILADHKVSIPIRDALFPLGNFLRNFVRNVGGPIALLTVWFLPFAPQRRFFLYMAAIIVLYIGFGGSLGYGPYTRYELAVQPLIIFLMMGGLLGLRKFMLDTPSKKMYRDD